MAIYVTNPYGRMRHNGALNALVAKHLGLKSLKSEAARDAVKAFKRSAEYKAWLAKNDKAVATERSAKKERTATSKKSGKNFLTEILGYTRAGKGKAAKLVRPAAKPSKKTAAAAEAPVVVVAAAGKRADGDMFKNTAGRYMIVVDGRARFANKEQIAAHEAVGTKKGGRKTKAKANPSRRHRSNPSLEGVKAALMSEVTLNSLLSAGVAGGTHFVLVPKVAPFLAKAPLVGAYLAKAPYAVTGLIGAAAFAVGGAYTDGKVRNALLSVGGAVASVGIALDVFNYLMARGAPAVKSDKAGLFESEMAGLYESDMAGLYENGVEVVGNPYAGVEVVSNPFDFAGTAAFGGTGGSNDVGTLASSYGAAKMSDAAMAPLDFTVEEGQAMMDGPGSIVRKFGLPPTVLGARSAEFSRLASQPMHRWAWLCRLVGFEKASQIAALPPETRLKVIAALKRQALLTVNKALSAVPQQAVMNTTLLTDYASLGAHGAMAATDFGATIFAGAGY